MKMKAETRNEIWQFLDRAFGVFLTGFFSVAILGFFMSGARSSTDISAFLLCVLFVAWGIYLISKGSKRKKLGRAFRVYTQILADAPRISLYTLAEETETSLDVVRSNLQWLIRKGFFENAKIDDDSNSLILRGRRSTERVPDAEMLCIKCKACGASCMVPRGQYTPCEYCGTMVKGEE
ncbi:MAG: hypothetical protein ACI4PL_00445 [Faecousia sp.]